MSPVYTARSGKKEASSRRNLVSKETSEIISYQMLDLREEYIYIYYSYTHDQNLPHISESKRTSACTIVIFRTYIHNLIARRTIFMHWFDNSYCSVRPVPVFSTSPEFNGDP